MGFEVGILTPGRLTSKEEGKQVLDLLCDEYEELMPERYGDIEPLRNIFDPQDREKPLEMWTGCLFWKRRRLKVSGAVMSSDPRRGIHGMVSISVDGKSPDVDALKRFTKAAAVRLNADFGFLHMLAEAEIPVGRRANLARQPYRLLITTHQLRKSIPNMYWATIFGRAYIEHFGRDRLLSVPAPVVEELGPSCIYIQLSQSPYDLETDHAKVQSVRQSVKRHLDNNSFFDPDAPADHVYDAPAFYVEPSETAQQHGSEAGPPDVADYGSARAVGVDAKLQEAMSSAADEAVRMAKEQFGISLDLSEQSVESVEHIMCLLEKRSSRGQKGPDANGADEDLERWSLVWGAYIGEVLRMHLGGEWYWETRFGGRIPGLKMEKMTVYPPLKVFKRLTSGGSDDIWMYYRGLDTMLRENQ